MIAIVDLFNFLFSGCSDFVVIIARAT